MCISTREETLKFKESNQAIEIARTRNIARMIVLLETACRRGVRKFTEQTIFRGRKIERVYLQKIYYGQTS